MNVYAAILEPALAQRSRTRALTSGVFESAAGLLYPPHCMACGLPLEVHGNGAICGACAGKVLWVGADRCRRCGERAGAGRGSVEACPACERRPPVFVAQSCAVAQYDDPLRALILGLKFSGSLQALPLLARLLAQRVHDTQMLEGLDAKQTALVPVPMHRREFAARGFNQAEEVARLAAKHLGIRVETGLLRKLRPTRPQATLGADARRENLRDAFAADAKKAARYAQGCAILVDDVMTTGSTAGECAKALRAAGVQEVRGAFVARG
ncbi:MAG: ComF family protein [Planctomycetes bacterium]|nr:ComF family protein [Planctomycetota bacterium]